MKLSVVILNYNVRYFLEICLRSVEAALSDIDAEIILVDNHSSDDSCDMVSQLFPHVILIKNEQNLGFSKGNAIGVAVAKGVYVCILNPDTVVGEDTFKTCLNYADGIPDLGILGCQLVDGRGQFLPESKRNIPRPKIAIKKVLGLSNGYYANHLKPSEGGPVSVLVGAFLLLKKQVYDNVGGFDEDYFMYGEDIDLSYRILKAGYHNHYYGQISCIHFKGESTIKDKTYARHFYGAMQLFYHKHFKSNLCFDTLVRMGVWMSSALGKTSKQSPSPIKEYLLVSNNPEFGAQLPFNYKSINSNTAVTKGSQVIFDANTLSFKEIIESMVALSSQDSVSFRILSADAQFIIGSDSSQQRGEVLLLK
ncbi:glycosyltransferase family 2 protein [Gelidibacter salicanalis]|uniref:Glycosyltransferase family 2 protein n=1 Tax=Gelidibacter salicanalis TaxID=291193 RepID=A0A5C7AS43_9FLAO|nr:glycosyltransferase family 2 protein [Gelidibacter salicanalis]TXE10383.1 glycosyltransferase family 2 protein [Gelidibacter salicanalis]